MIELWIFVSTMCVHAYPNHEQCFQQIRISTMPEVSNGEERHFVCDFVGHRWIKQYFGVDRQKWLCSWCRQTKIMVMKETWEEEKP